MTIDCINISKKFKNNNVLSDVNIHFETGKIYGLSGRNGSGKTVFLKTLCGLYFASSGDILLNNKKMPRTEDTFSG